MTSYITIKWYIIIGDKMKKTLRTIIASMITGAILSGITIYYLQEKFAVFDEKNIVTAYQIGVYKTKDNADKASSLYPGSISVLDGDYYRVFVGVAKDKTCETLLENYFFNQNINVYPKSVEVTNQFYKEISLYESNIDKENMQVYEKVNQEILKKLAGEMI